jgi:hypothetical protein
MWVSWCRRSLLLVLVLAAMAGCAGCGDDSGTMVTGNPGDPTVAGDQSETDTSVTDFQGKRIVTVTYNDLTDVAGKIDYTPMTRVVKSGATLMGWSNSTDGGKTWKYGGTLTPPKGWSVLWSDPATTADRGGDQRYVFISNLAVPSSKMPAGGISGPIDDHIGGACIARSVDGGISFKHYQCVTNESHFYDGGSMAAAGGLTDRHVFAAFVDVDTAKIDVWASPTPWGSFNLLSSPFPGMKMFSHPRLRYDRAEQALYAAALDANGITWITRWRTDFGWSPPRVASLTTAGNPIIQLSDRKLRTAYQFSFDVGAPTFGQDDQAFDDRIRVVYTVKDPDTQKLYVRGAVCDIELKNNCKDVPQWGTTPGNLNVKGQQFSPSVRAYRGSVGQEPGWKVTYLSTDDDPQGNTVSIKQGNLARLANGTALFVPFGLVKGQVICPDNRGYWGDYNELQVMGVEKGSTIPRFIMPYSDSTKGCPTRWEFTSQELHVSAVTFK